MAYKVEFDDKLQLQKIIGRKLKDIAKLKGINIENWGKLVGMKQGNLSQILNGVKGVSQNKLIELAETIGLSEKQLNDLIVEAKKDELKIFYGVDLNSINLLSKEELEKLRLLDNLDLETINLLKDLDLDGETADFLKDIAGCIKGQNGDRFLEDLKVILKVHQNRNK